MISSVSQTGSIAAIKKPVQASDSAFALLIWQTLSPRKMFLLKLGLPLVFFILLENSAATVKGKRVIITSFTNIVYNFY